MTPDTLKLDELEETKGKKPAKEVTDPVAEEPTALLNTVPTYAPPKEHTGLKDAVAYEPVDQTKTERPDLLSRLHNALEAASDDVTAAYESRLASLVYELESRVGLV